MLSLIFCKKTVSKKVVFFNENVDMQFQEVSLRWNHFLKNSSQQYWKMLLARKQTCIVCMTISCWHYLRPPFFSRGFFHLSWPATSRWRWVGETPWSSVAASFLRVVPLMLRRKILLCSSWVVSCLALGLVSLIK